MMKKITLTSIVACLLCAGSVQATRVLEVLERSHELRLTDATLPQSTQGRMGFKTCESCAWDYMPVSESTLYFVGWRTATLGEVAEEAARIRRVQGASDSTLVMLHFDPKTEVATRIRILRP